MEPTTKITVNGRVYDIPNSKIPELFAWLEKNGSKNTFGENNQNSDKQLLVE